MARKFSVRNVEAARPSATPYELHDTDVKGLLLRVQPSGVKSFVVQWGRGRRVTLKPRYPVLTLEGARTKAREVLLDADKHGTPEQARGRKKPKVTTLRAFIDETYAPVVSVNHRSGERNCKRLKGVFAEHLDKPLGDLNAWVIEKWRSRRLKAGTAPATVNRDLAALKAALAKAVEWGALSAHPLQTVKLRKVDNKRVRYLTDAEEMRLRTELARRDTEAIDGRGRANEWREERGYTTLPVLPDRGFADHLTPMVLVALNTGLRRGELTQLEWTDIDLHDKLLTVRAAAAKGGKSRHVQLNREAVAVLTRWKKQTSAIGLVFNVRDVKTAWLALMTAAKIKNFTFHDLRHTFASRLVTAHVDLNTVRELLGHADLKMTLRYAHLAPEHKARAVELVLRKCT